MKITKKPSKATEVHLVLTPEASELGSLKRHVLSHFQDQAKVPGFRPGTAPPEMIEKSIDPNALQTEFLQHAVNQYYGKAIEAEILRPLGQPEINITKFVPYSQLEIEVKVGVLGLIVVPDYKKIKVAKPAVKVSAKDVDEVVETLRQRGADRKAVERPSKNGDEVTIDFDGYDKTGSAVPGASAKSNPLILGSGAFIPGFEDNLIGLKAGEDKEFKVTFPSSYGVKSLAGQPVDFKVKVLKVSEVVDSKADDGLAAKVGPFKTLAELKADVKKQLEAEREAQAAREYENAVVSQISSKSRVDVPESLVEQELTRMEDEEKRNIAFRGQTWEEHLKEENVTAQEHRERQRPMATERVKGGLVLSEIAEKEKIQVSDEEVKQRIELLKSQYQDQQMRTELDKPENRNDIISRILTEKTVELLVKTASKK